MLGHYIFAHTLRAAFIVASSGNNRTTLYADPELRPSMFGRAFYVRTLGRGLVIVLALLETD